mgnify:CR=1 FL=1
MSYGEIIKTARKRLAMTQGDLSDKVGCTRTTICDWERESYPPTDGQNIARLEAALELPPGTLYKTIFVDPTAPRERPGDRKRKTGEEPVKRDRRNRSACERGSNS